ncbi:E3 ubiquitin-protein ligase RHF1A-like [Abrus precatorius]|uniref:RING-type E3 ubiquitin transferase n=1 Tax=Abrus precatorius TaxID=3816 RepID=A0A8B8JS22_ABRPR|nr:E3 ubiquitin-protein ligase RHF1A-like [Abrus precatorius]
MANFTSSFLSPPSMSYIATSLPSAAFDDTSDDACSICLEPFSTVDPATTTSCKHEYHLHCILEWSQRSKECPICWQLLILEDPGSQELLNAVEAEKRLRSRTVCSHASTTNSGSPYERLSDAQDDSCSDDSDFDEQLMQQVVAATDRAPYICRRGRQRSLGVGPSEVLVFNSSLHASGMRPRLTTSSSGDSSPNSGAPRVIYGQPSPESVRGLDTREMFSLPESIKSKLSAASARCKESISKNTRGLKEKLIARNASVKELSKGVQREMNAGIAGVARMIERLDLATKLSSTPLRTSGFHVKGKSIQESGESGVLVGDFSSNAPSLDSTLVAVGVEIPASCVQTEHDAART